MELWPLHAPNRCLLSSFHTAEWVCFCHAPPSSRYCYHQSTRRQIMQTSLVLQRKVLGYIPVVFLLPFMFAAFYYPHVIYFLKSNVQNKSFFHLQVAQCNSISSFCASGLNEGIYLIWFDYFYLSVTFSVCFGDWLSIYLSINNATIIHHSGVLKTCNHVCSYKS